MWSRSPTTGHLADRAYTLSPHNAATEIAAGRVRVFPRREKVALIGGVFHRAQAPVDDPSWEIWTCNLIAPYDADGRLRADRWFDLHQREAQTADDLRWIRACPVPIYVPADLLDQGPRCVPYPLQDVEELYGGYWACTFGYQIALALLEGFTDIGLFGIDLGLGNSRERTVEWANTSWWMGLAEGRGCRIHLPRGALMGRHPARYGLEYAREKDWVARYVDGWYRNETFARGGGRKVSAGGGA